ncbi:hypothetical protein [Paremcibacter congregatus]|uniref:hypothetical protein n=1 Tax=Paremcibacter congregatus TaxID=2043170 RepID=UPI003A92C44E
MGKLFDQIVFFEKGLSFLTKAQSLTTTSHKEYILKRYYKGDISKYTMAVIENYLQISDANNVLAMKSEKSSKKKLGLLDCCELNRELGIWRDLKSSVSQ